MSDLAILTGPSTFGRIPLSGDPGDVIGGDGVSRPEAGGGITQLTGDGTAGPGSGSQALTLANTAVTPGTYGSATKSTVMTVDAKGRITAASETTIAGASVGALLTADPGSPADDTWWVVRTGSSPTQTVALKVRIGGTTYTLAAFER